MISKHNAATVADVRPYVLLADHVGMRWVQASLYVMLFEADKRIIERESQ
jgi:hypothetical protein